MVGWSGAPVRDNLKDLGKSALSGQPPYRGMRYPRNPGSLGGCADRAFSVAQKR